ncbi:hypothetical protein P7H19_25865 [Paenibacillus larvae]|nr:hypothetical protein [Paenibacillus larvae]MDT2239036.1 hypothetical protein [Paenibacillus larvae]
MAEAIRYTQSMIFSGIVRSRSASRRRSSKTNTTSLRSARHTAKTREYRAAEEFTADADVTCCKWASAPGGGIQRYIIAMQKAAGINEADAKNNDLAAKEWMNYEPLPTNTCGRALF